MIPEWNSFINGDCMDYLKEFTDNYFDIAVVDPPYGGGLCENGGCKGRWAKYHQTPENLGGGWSVARRTLRTAFGKAGRVTSRDWRRTRQNQKNDIVGHCP